MQDLAYAVTGRNVVTALADTGETTLEACLCGSPGAAERAGVCVGYRLVQVVPRPSRNAAIELPTLISEPQHEIGHSHSVLGFWDKNTGNCAGAMLYRRDSPATTRI